MSDNPHRTYEIRCPIYGFIKISDWERQIIAQPAFQRLRRIRQLAWTDFIYPGAMHSRFEHSLGVMHMATMLYDGIVERSRHLLEEELGYVEDGLRRHRVLIRLTALLHDVGHAPFSHASEELFPTKISGGERYVHEDYSASICRRHFRDVIRDHPLNRNYDFTEEDVANLLEGGEEAGHAIFWRDLISGQMDADRMDYLVRDAHHAGVGYGRYDWRRIVNTIRVVPSVDDGSPRIGVGEDGLHAAESLILARYFMFTQVYFHKTRVAYDHHLHEALKVMLPGGVFPAPIDSELEDYLAWDDWQVLGRLANDEGGEHGRRIAARNHYRMIAQTPETPSDDDLRRLNSWREALHDMLAFEGRADKSWYKLGATDIPVFREGPTRKSAPLSRLSSPVEALRPIRQVLLYVRPEDRGRANQSLNKGS